MKDHSLGLWVGVTSSLEQGVSLALFCVSGSCVRRPRP